MRSRTEVQQNCLGHDAHVLVWRLEDAIAMRIAENAVLDALNAFALSGRDVLIVGRDGQKGVVRVA